MCDWNVAKQPEKWRDGGILQLRAAMSASVTNVQNEWTGEQVHVSCK